MPLSPSVLKKLKDPFGLLIPDLQVSAQTIRDEIKGAKLVAAVGDATTERLVSLGIIPDIAVIDGIERRSTRRLPASYPAAELRCSNPAGSITSEAEETLRAAISGSHPSRVIVTGEEDLLALPLFHLLPLGSVVLYGQPLQGLVLVRITLAKKKEAKDLMKMLQN